MASNSINNSDQSPQDDTDSEDSDDEPIIKKTKISIIGKKNIKEKFIKPPTGDKNIENDLTCLNKNTLKANVTTPTKTGVYTKKTIATSLMNSISSPLNSISSVNSTSSLNFNSSLKSISSPLNSHSFSTNPTFSPTKTLPSGIGQVTLIQRNEALILDQDISSSPLNLSLTKGSPYQCIVNCDQTFYNNAKLKIHYILTHNLSYCKLCDLIFATPAEKSEHEDKTHSFKICELCQVCMDDPRQVSEHYRKEHDALVCDFCGILLYPRMFYDEHILKKHNTTEKFIAEKFLTRDVGEKGKNVECTGKNAEWVGKNVECPGKNIEGPRKNIEDPRKNIEGPRKNIEGPRKNIEGKNAEDKYYILVDAIEKHTFTCNVCEKVRDREMVGHFISYHKINVYNMIESLQEQNLEKETLYTMERIEHFVAFEEENIRMMSKCGVCKASNLSPEAYALHLAYCSHKSVCYYCQRMWNSIEDLDMHVFQEHTRFKCTLGCDNLAYNTYENLKRHYNSNHNRVICIYCNDFVSNESNNVVQHLSELHKYSAKNSMMFHDCLLENVGREGDKVIVCTLCDLNLMDVAWNVEKLTLHFREFHGVKWEQILTLIGPNLLDFNSSRIDPKDARDENTEPNDELDGMTDENEEENTQYLKWKKYNYQYKVTSDYIKCIYNPQTSELDQSEPTNKAQKCHLCNISLVSDEELLQHIYDTHDFHLKDEVSLCTLCNSLPSENKDFKFHDHIKHSELLSVKEEVSPCIKCDINISGRRGRDHILENHPEDLEEFDVDQYGIKCRFCEKHFWTNGGLNVHENEKHLLGNESQFFVCYMCRAAFSNRESLSAHDNCKERFNGVFYQCLTCNLTYPDSLKLKLHLLKEHPKSINIMCPSCGKLYGKKKYVLQHIKKLHMTGSPEAEDCFDCTLCGKKFKSTKSLKLHKNQSHGRGFKCVICAKKFFSFEERKLHYSQEHPGQLIFECKICSKTFFSKSGLHRHTKIHDQSMNRCEYCGKEFVSKDSFKEHVLIHIGPKHQCPYCPKAFTQKSNLRRHIRLHTGVKPYSCPYCPKKFSDKGACKSHILVHTREEECNCLVCGKKFSKIQKLKYHMKLHTGEGLYDCDLCGKQFTTTYRLRDHRALHNQGTQYMCECGKTFTKEKYLERHVSTVHKTEMKMKVVGKPYKCILCHNWYAVRPSINKHIKKMHGIPQSEMKNYIESHKPEKNKSKKGKDRTVSSEEEDEPHEEADDELEQSEEMEHEETGTSEMEHEEVEHEEVEHEEVEHEEIEQEEIEHEKIKREDLKSKERKGVNQRGNEDKNSCKDQSKNAKTTKSETLTKRKRKGSKPIKYGAK